MKHEGIPIANYIMIWVAVMVGINLGSIAMLNVGLPHLLTVFIPSLILCSVTALVFKNRLVGE